MRAPTVRRVAGISGDYALGPDNGRIIIKTSRAGVAAMAGHDLTIEMTRWSARAVVPQGAVTSATVTARLELGSLAVRSGSGGAKALTDSDRHQIEATMRKILGDGTAAFSSTGIIPAGAGGAIEGTLTLNGRTQPVRLQLTALARGRYRGTATITQSAFGIKPYRGFLGALKLNDEVVVEIEADLNRAHHGDTAGSEVSLRCWTTPHKCPTVLL